jgi:hypothetical protein
MCGFHASFLTSYPSFPPWPLRVGLTMSLSSLPSPLYSFLHTLHVRASCLQHPLLPRRSSTPRLEVDRWFFSNGGGGIRHEELLHQLRSPSSHFTSTQACHPDVIALIASSGRSRGLPPSRCTLHPHLSLPPPRHRPPPSLSFLSS